jgi:CubicO group peptidase (beta-lactamase class C family)
MNKVFLAGAVLALAASASGCHGGQDDASSSSSDVNADDDAPLMTVDAMIARAKKRDYWPDGSHDWRTAPADVSSDACRSFTSFMFPAADADAKTAASLGVSVDKLKDEQQALRTDGALVVKGGEIVWESYVGPYAGHPEKRHCLWSATKSITTGIVAAVVQSGKTTRAGKPVVLGTPLSEITSDSTLDPRLARMTVEDLLSMNIPDAAWNEGYDGNLTTSSVVKMLWVDGPLDMGRYAASALLGVAPPGGTQTSFRYSSGAALILMRAFKELYGADYDRMPWTALFDRLGMRSAVLERDRNGVYVGSSYAHMTLRDMARFGYAYLNGGWFAGDQVVSAAFVDKARLPGKAMTAPGTTDDGIVEEGAFYSTGFWINPVPARVRPGTKLAAKLFPNTPVDVFFAAGHYGQNIIIFPKDDLMIVRMSHDNEYFSKLDAMMSRARACFLGGGR